MVIFSGWTEQQQQQKISSRVEASISFSWLPLRDDLRHWLIRCFFCRSIRPIDLWVALDLMLGSRYYALVSLPMSVRICESECVVGVGLRRSIALCMRHHFNGFSQKTKWCELCCWFSYSPRINRTRLLVSSQSISTNSTISSFDRAVSSHLCVFNQTLR